MPPEHSIGSNMPAKSLELKHTIKLIQELTSEIDEIETAIKSIMDEIHSPILTIPGISYRMGAMIIAEIGDFNRFNSADKILAYAGMSPSTYQSGQLDNCYSHMEKRGSRYLRYALYNATKYVCHWDPIVCCIPCKETSRRQALQCCYISCRQKTGSSHLCNGKVRAGVQQSILILFCKYLLF